MNNDNKTILFSFNADIPHNGKIEIPSENFLKLKEKGFSTVEISVYGDVRKAVEDSGYDLEQFDKIRSLQSLPDNIVFNFLKTKGNLYKSNLEKRITF